MSDDSRKSVDTLRPPEGDDDVYSASTKVGEAAPEILELVRKAEAEAAMKAPRVPSDIGENAPAAKAVPAAASEPEASPPSAAGRAALDAAAEETPAEEAPATPEAAEVASAHSEPERTEQGIPPLSLLVLAIAAMIAMWLGYQALHAPPPTPASAPVPAAPAAR